MKWTKRIVISWFFGAVFKNKRQIDLRISKQIEREVDEEIERVQKILHDKQNPQLF